MSISLERKLSVAISIANTFSDAVFCDGYLIALKVFAALLDFQRRTKVLYVVVLDALAIPSIFTSQEILLLSSGGS